VKTNVLMLSFILACLAACGTQKVVEKPVLVETVRVERVPVPADLLALHQPTTIPESMTYGEAMQLWSADRGIIHTLLGQIEAIRSLNESD
jgi:hypothetical protein